MERIFYFLGGEMNKAIILSVTSCLLCACAGSMQGLRVHNAGQPGKQEIGGGLYYNDPEAGGHSEQVKHKVIDELHAQVQIPVQYQEKMEPLPKKLPGVLKSALKEYDLKSPGECSGSCALTDKTFTLDLNYISTSENTCGTVLLASIFLWPLLPITAPIYVNMCTGIELENQMPVAVSILNPFESLNEKNLGVRINYEAVPKDMTLSCTAKYCELTDGQGNPVNQIHITKKMSVDQKRINQLLSAQAAAAEKRKREAEAAAAKRKREEEEARQLMEQGEVICPRLYDEMWGSGNLQYRRSDVIAYTRWAKQWQTYYCDSWLRRATSY